METELDNGNKVLSLYNAIRIGGGVERLSKLVLEIIREDRWRRYRLPMTEGTFEWDSFDKFCEVELKLTFDELKELCNAQARAAIDKLRVRSRGRPRKGEGPSPFTKANTGSIEAMLRRLDRDRPDLYEQVAAGELDPTAAMKIAGFQRKRIRFYPDDPKAVAATLQRHMSEEALAELKELL